MIFDERTPTLEEMVYSRIEEEILSGKLERGRSLGEIPLSKRLGVSRTPVRSALHRLAEEGLVEISANRGATVVGINVEDIIDIYKLRERVEGLASALAASRISEEELSRLNEALELTEFYIERGDTEHMKELDTVFHSIIYKASGSRFLEKTLSELHRKTKAYRKRSLSVSGRTELSAAEHREIYEAIKCGDADKADALTSRHVRNALENIVASTDGGRDGAFSVKKGEKA